MTSVNLKVADKRDLRRDDVGYLGDSVRFVLYFGDKIITPKLMNYHFQGACFQLPKELPYKEFTNKQQNGIFVDFYLGKKCVSRKIPCRVAWESFNTDGSIGLEFMESTRTLMRNFDRLPTHKKYKPTLTAADPLDPHRMIFLTVEDFSANGMLLMTSLVNRHLLPGLQINQATLQIPGHENIKVDFNIQNARPSESAGSFLVGVKITGKIDDFSEKIKQYITIISPANVEEKHRLQLIAKSGFSNKKIKQGLSFKVINTSADYEALLKLRYEGYGKHGKLVEGASWQDQGEGLSTEGLLIGGYLAGQLVAAMELRFSFKGPTLRTFKYCAPEERERLPHGRIGEINKLVIHPSIQGSDIVLGFIQKIQAILISHEVSDVLITSTEKLTPFYQRIGCKITGVQVDHPTLRGVKLNVLHMPSDVYLQSKDLNPFAWGEVYEVTQRYMELIGLSKHYKMSLKKKIFKTISPILFLLKKKLKIQSSDKPKSTQFQNSPLTQQNSQFIDPKYTEQHFMSSVMLAYIFEARDAIGKDRVKSILSKIGVPEDYFYKEGNWLSVKFLDDFLDLYAAYGNVSELSYSAGWRSLSHDVLGLKFYILKHIITTELAFKTSEQVLRQLNRSRRYELIESKSGYCKIKVGVADKSLLPKHRESCSNWRASFEAYVKVTTGHSGNVLKTSCCYDGADACTYEVYWNTQSLKVRSFLPLISAIGFSFATFLTLKNYFDAFESALGGLALFSSFYILSIFVKLKNYKVQLVTITDSFKEFEEDTQEKYNELQIAKVKLDRRYFEAQLLEQTSKAIQGSSKLDDVLNISMKAVVETFGFDRTFLMLIDESKKILQTSSVFMSDKNENIDLIWKFKVDISIRRENPLILSSVYFTKNPVLIDDTEKYMFQFNEASQKLIQSLGSRGFVMVPVPSDQGCWGVMIADKKDKGVVDRNDLVVLQRLAQHIGLSLDKISKIESVETLKNTFQKYVPKQLLNQIDSGEESKLGGQTKAITCLFLDIRDFTAKSESLPPQAIISWVNHLFNDVCKSIIDHHGIVDKFLGDGLFATWGAFKSEDAHPQFAVKCALDILQKLKEINVKNKDRGLPEVKIGVGIHYGTAIVGNIGSNDRMEFTAIGSTVNLASRLECLNKIFDSQIVVSGQVLEKLEPSMQEQFSIHMQTQVRGVASSIKVGSYQESKMIETIVDEERKVS